MSRRLSPLVLLCLAPIAAGCGTKTINQQSAESLARKGLAHTKAGPAKSIKCPSSVEAKVGKTLDCEIKLVSGASLTFTERVDSVHGDKGHLTIVAAKQH